MPQYLNDTAKDATLEWCVNPDHYKNDEHTGTEDHVIKTHIVIPGAVLSFSDAPNKTDIIAACTVKGLADTPEEI